MTVPADKTYPATATNAAWQKKKSFVDKTKASTKTGLGATLTDAETKWKAIAWAKLDAATLGAKTVSAAQKNLDAAKLAVPNVSAARLAIKAAESQAQNAATNNALSGSAKTAAGTILTTLKAAEKRLEGVNVTDFEAALKKLKDAEKVVITGLRVVSAGKEVAKTGQGEWDRKVLKVIGLTWTVGKAADYKGKRVTVSGKPVNTNNAEGISHVFENDMTLDSISGTTVIFKA